MIPRLTRGDFDRVAAWCGMGSVRFDDLKPVFEAVLAAMSPLAKMPALQLKQPKALSVDDPGAFDGSNSSAMDDPLNTFVRRCNVAPTTPVFCIMTLVTVVGVRAAGGWLPMAVRTRWYLSLISQRWR
jgi:hypothetical protein